jgi:hypothetical protein
MCSMCSGYFEIARRESATHRRVHNRRVARSVLLRVLQGTWDANIRFTELCDLLRRLEFAERIRGSHHIFTRDGVAEILNLQPKGSLAKPYQVKQVRHVLVEYKLAGEPE